MADRNLAPRNENRKAAPGEVFAMLRRIVAENGRDYIGLYALATVCLVLVAATTGLAAWIMKPLVDYLFVQQRYDRAPLICGAIIVIFIIRGIATYGQAVTLSRIGNGVVARYQKRIFQHLMKLGVSFYNDTRSGRLAAQINENVVGIRDLLGVTLKSIAGDLVSLVGLVGVMVWQQPVLAASIFLIGPPLVWAVDYIMRRVRRVTRESVEINSHLIGAMQEAVQGITVVKAFTMEDQLTARISGLVDSAEARYNKIARVSERLAPVSEMLAGFAVAGVVGYATYRAATDNHPPGDIMAFITALLLAYDPVRRLARTQVNVERALVNARMIYEILDLEPQQGDAPDDLYVIRSGEFTVRKDTRDVATLGTDQWFGEIGLLRRTPRTASVDAATDGVVWRIPGYEFLAAITEAASPPSALLDDVSSRLVELDALGRDTDRHE